MSQLTIIETMNPVEIYGSGKLKDIIGKIVDEVRGTPTDISTPKGRKEIASLAHKVARSKTYLDDLGKKLGEEAKKTLEAINAERKIARDELDALKEEVRKPLTEWEEKEEMRVANHEKALAMITERAKWASENFQTLSSQEIKDLIANTDELFNREWEEFKTRAHNDHTYTTARIAELHVQKVKQEDDAAELARLKAAEAERAQKEHEERLKAEAAEQARVLAESIAKIEADKVAAAAKREEEQRALQAEVERQKALKEKQDQEAKLRAAEQARLKAESDAKEAALKAERDKQAAVDAERAKIEREKAAAIAAEEKRAASKRHVAKVNNEVLEAINRNVPGLNEDQVKAIIFALATGKIPYTKLTY